MCNTALFFLCTSIVFLCTTIVQANAKNKYKKELKKRDVKDKLGDIEIIIGI